MAVKRILLILVFSVAVLKSAAFAGFLSGNTSPNVDSKGLFAVRLNTSILMVETPFSAVMLSGKYAYDDKISVFGKAGVGTIDYSTVSTLKLTYDPQIYTFGIDYLFSGTRAGQYNSFIAEFEEVSWGINNLDNKSNEILLGFDFGSPPSNNLRTRYRVALQNFYAGPNSGDNIASSAKYSLSTELEYSFTKNYRSSFEAGIYFGDAGGLITYFGLGFGFNS